MSEPQTSMDLTALENILSTFGEVSDGDLIPILQRIQESYGYLPEDVLLALSKRTGISASRIYGVTTFYEQFHHEPRGKHIIRCCRGTACHVRGGSEVIEAISEHLGIGPDETTEDMMFTFETVACLGTCALAPVMMVDGVYHGKMTPNNIKTIIDDLRASQETC